MHTFRSRPRKIVWMEDLLVLITRIPTSVRDTSTQSADVADSLDQISFVRLYIF